MTPAGAVLTGGRSSRMGRDKAFVEVDGVAMGARMVATLRAAGCEPVVFVGGDQDGLAALGADVVSDSAPGEGPLAGVVTALEASAGVAGLVVVVSCDLPFLQVDDVTRLIRRAETTTADVVLARADRTQPLCAVWATVATERVRDAFDRGVRSMHGVLEELAVDEVRLPVGSLRNINTLGDLDQ